MHEVRYVRQHDGVFVTSGPSGQDSTKASRAAERPLFLFQYSQYNSSLRFDVPPQPQSFAVSQNNTIPKLKAGLLPKGIWRCTGAQFIGRFCRRKSRALYAVTAHELFDFAARRGAISVFVGGSFVTDKQKPDDFDCIIVFEKESQIPDRTARFEIEGTNLDVFFCAEDQPDILASFIAVFSRTRDDRECGVIEVILRDEDRKAIWEAPNFGPTPETLELARSIYFQRHVINWNNQRRALITIHGIRSHGEWNAEISHIASSSGWIIAPFTYGYVEPTTVARESERQKIVDQFRDHINDIFDRYNCNISVIAHSFGTYVVARYLLGFDVPPVYIDTLILTGSILNESLDIDRFKGRVFKVINEVAPNDSVVSFAPLIGQWKDPLLGNSGKVGFKSSSTLLDQRTCEVFTHNNVIRRDVVSKRWMPWLEINAGRSGISPRALRVLTEYLARADDNDDDDFD